MEAAKKVILENEAGKLMKIEAKQKERLTDIKNLEYMNQEAEL